MAKVKVIRILAVLGLIALLVLGAILLVKHKKQSLAKAPKYGMQALPVRVATAHKGNIERSQSYLSVVQPIRVAEVSARLTAMVERVLHDENEVVKAGEVLVVLDGRQITDSVAAAKAQVEAAKADLASNQATVESLGKNSSYWQREAQRDGELAKKGAIPVAQAEGTADKASEAQGKLDAARKKSSALRRQIEASSRKQSELETTLDYCTIRSPFDGVVSRRKVDPGDMASPGKSLMTVEDRSQVKLAFDVPQQDLERVHQGLPVNFTVVGKERRAVLSHMFASLNAARMLRGEVYLSGAAAAGLRCGAFTRLRVVLDSTKDVTLVPSSSLIESPDRKPYVFLVSEGQLQARPVSILGANGENTAVKGVREGEQVVLSTFLGWAKLSAGIKVEAMR